MMALEITCHACLYWGSHVISYVAKAQQGHWAVRLLQRLLHDQSQEDLRRGSLLGEPLTSLSYKRQICLCWKEPLEQLLSLPSLVHPATVLP